jgi:hypothetical protein
MKKRRVFLAAFLMAVIGTGIFFLARPPVVIVIDDAFLELYGKKRADTRRYMLSLSLMRRVVFAVVSEEGGREAAEFVVSAAAKKPYLALFPERYLEGADRYATAARDAGLTNRTVVAGSGNEENHGGVNIGNTESLRIDRETDLYRAGMCAAIIANEGIVGVYYQDSLPTAYRDVFREGLAAGGYTKTPFFYRYTETASQTDIGCAVLLSAVNTSLLVNKKDVPAVLFSWLDPEYTPNGVMVVFDDSLPAVAEQVVKNVTPVVAQARVLTERVRIESDLKALQTAVQAKRPSTSTPEGS